jgi:hypothetical protein
MGGPSGPREVRHAIDVRPSIAQLIRLWMAGHGEEKKAKE